MRKILSNNVIILVLAVAVGILLGKYADNSAVLAAAQTIKSVSSQLIFFLVPLIVLAFVASAVTSLKSNATRLFLFAFLIAYLSSEASAMFSLLLSYTLVPLLHCSQLGAVRTLPEAVFTFAIPPVMNVISALFLAIFIGLGVVWTKATAIIAVLSEFRELMLVVVKRVLLPVLPFYIAANFYLMAWQGSIDSLIVFLPVIAIIVMAHFVWIVILYTVATIYSRKNAFDILRHYAPAYFTALGTMSSAATLGVALHCARKSKVLRADVSEFSIPLFANIHLCGATLTETFFLAVVSQLLYGHLPAPGVFLLFILFLGVFAVGAPGVPGGTAFASVGIVTSVLGFDDNGVALFLALFALEDCFGTSCNILGDGALSLILQTYNDRNNKETKQLNN